MTSSTTVTLTDGLATLQTPPDTELSIHEVAQWTGYNPLSLRRLDNAASLCECSHHRDEHSITPDDESDCHECDCQIFKTAKKGFPPAHHKLGGTSRYWFAYEIEEIMAFKVKTAELSRKRMSSMYKLANAKRRKAKATATATATATAKAEAAGT